MDHTGTDTRTADGQTAIGQAAVGQAADGRTADAATRFYTRMHAQADSVALLAAPTPDLSVPRHRYHCVYRHLAANPGLEVCELGVGAPWLLRTLAPLTRSFDIADIIDCTGGSLPPNARLTLTNLDERFPYPDASFDSVIAMMVIEHLYDPFFAFAEVARICRPGGTVFVNLPNIAALRCRLQLLAGRMPVTSTPVWWDLRQWDGNHLHHFTVADTVRLAALNGLGLTGMHPVGRHLWLKRLRPQLFCHEISYQFRKTDGA